MSELEFLKSIKFFHEPSLLRKGVLKWAPICLPADMGSSLISVLAYKPEKSCLTVNSLIDIIKV